MLINLEIYLSQWYNESSLKVNMWVNIGVIPSPEILIFELSSQEEFHPFPQGARDG